MLRKIGITFKYNRLFKNFKGTFYKMTIQSIMFHGSRCGHGKVAIQKRCNNSMAQNEPKRRSRAEKQNRQLEKTKWIFVCQTFRSMRIAHLRSMSKLFVCLPERYAKNLCKPNSITPFLFPETFRTEPYLEGVCLNTE